MGHLWHIRMEEIRHHVKLHGSGAGALPNMFFIAGKQMLLALQATAECCNADCRAVHCTWKLTFFTGATYSLCNV